MHSIEITNALNDLLAVKYYHNIDIRGARNIVEAARTHIRSCVEAVNRDALSLLMSSGGYLYSYALGVLERADDYLRSQYNHPYNDCRDSAVPDMQPPL